MFEVKQCVQHGLQVSCAKPAIETFREALQVNICCIHEAKEFFTRFLADIPGCDRHGSDSELVTRLRHVTGVLHKDNWIVIGKGNTRASESAGGLCNRLRRGFLGQGIDFP
jgi:hypothetical protein